jgi:hypothetical protein
VPDAPSSGGPPARPPAGPPDLIGVALGSLLAGATAGAALVAAGLVILRDRLEGVLPLLLFAGIVAAVTTAWALTAPIADWWRRGLTAALAVFGAMMLTALTAPVDMVGGRVALAVFTAGMLLAFVAAARYARRSASPAG